jgi:hypothetical protein
MMEFWNFKDTGIILGHHWPWLLLALVLGVAVGWWTYGNGRGR